jgi:hypothetical protein
MFFQKKAKGNSTDNQPIIPLVCHTQTHRNNIKTQLIEPVLVPTLSTPTLCNIPFG